MIETSTSLTKGASEQSRNIIFGHCLTLKFKNQSGSISIVKMYIDPIDLGYNELGQGGFKFRDSHKPSEFLVDNRDGHLVSDQNYFISTFPRLNEFSQQSKQGYKFVFGYIGHQWEVKKYRNSKTFVDHDWFCLDIIPSSWRRKIVGEYWVISAPTSNVANKLALTIWQSSQTHV